MGHIWIRFSIIFATIFLCSDAYTQTKNNLILVDQISLEPIRDVQVTFNCIKCDDETGPVKAYSDVNGIIPMPFDVATMVDISHVSYNPEELYISGSESITIKLESKQTVMDDVVITAQHKPSSAKDAIHKIKIIDRKNIEKQGAVNLRDVLRNQTNIRISQDNILGSSTNIQGLSGQNVKILIDGIPVIGRQGGNIDLSQINLNDIDRIEIVEGPLSVEYGTNALAGTINLITKTNAPFGTQVLVNSYYESVGQYNVDGQIGFRKKANKFTLSGGRNFFDGWSSTDGFMAFPQSEIADHNRVDNWKPKTQYFAQGFFATKIRKVNLQLKSNYFTEKITNKGLPRAPYFETAFDEEYNTTRLDNSLILKTKFNNHGRIKMIFSKNDFDRIKNVYFKDLTTLQEQLSPNMDDQDTTQSNLFMARGTYSQLLDSSNVSFSIGYDINLENGSGSRINGKTKNIDDYAVFTSIEYEPTERIKLRPGLRYTYNSSYNAPLTPSINAQYSLGNSTIRGSYSKGFRSPSIKDLYFNFVDINHNIQGNENLQAETSDNFALSLSQDFKKDNKGCDWSASLFHNEISNLITLAQGVGNEFTYFNLNHFRTNGIQVNSEYTSNHWTFTLGGSYTGTNNDIGNSESKNDYYYTPEIISSIAFKSIKHNITIAGFYKYTGKVKGFTYINETDLQEIYIEDYHHLDFTATKVLWLNRVNWTVGLKNIIDVQDIQASVGASIHGSNSGTTQMNWGRSLFTSLRINLNTKTN